MARKKKAKPGLEIEELDGGSNTSDHGSLEARLVMNLRRQNSPAGRAMAGRLMKDYVGDFLDTEVDPETHATAMDMITANWFSTMMKNGVTSKDMQTIMKLKGEDVQKSQSVSVKLTADAKSVKSTDDFLRDGLIDNGDGKN